VGLLLLAGALQISLAACCFYFIGAQAAKKLILNENAPLDYVWAGWLIMNDPGAMNLAEGSVGRVVAAMFGLTGIIYFSMVLGFVIDAIRDSLDAIKKGRSIVVESNHILILGWTHACYLLLKELCLAHEDSCVVIVILCTEDRKEMLKRIEDVVTTSSRFEVIVRHGFPSNITDLTTVAASSAGSVIIPAPSGDSDVADNCVLSYLMALKAITLTPGTPVVVELRDIDNEVSKIQKLQCSDCLSLSSLESNLLSARTWWSC
jgi:hypothetical protein